MEARSVDRKVLLREGGGVKPGSIVGSGLLVGWGAIAMGRIQDRGWKEQGRNHVYMEVSAGQARGQGLGH